MRRLLLAVIVIAVGSVLRALRRGPKPVHRPPDPAAGVIAEVVVSRLEASNRQTARVRRRAVVLVSAVLAVGGAVVLPSRPAARVNVRTDAAHQVAMIGLASRPSLELNAHLDGLSVSTERAARRPLRQRDVFRVRLPATRDTCARMAARLGGTCGRPARSPNPARAPIDLEFSGVVIADLVVDGGRGIRIDTDGAGTTAALDAKVATLTVECIDRVSVSSTFGTEPISLACIGRSEREVWLTLGLPADSVAVIALHGVRRLVARAKGDRSVHTIREGSLQVDDEDEIVRSERTRTITVRSPRRETELNLLVRTRPETIDSIVEAPAASSVLDGQDERLPTEFARHSDLWFAVIGVVASLLATVGIDALVRSK